MLKQGSKIMCIPKIIHYCWFGRNEMPEKIVYCIGTWKKYCPDYTFMLWNEDNYDITCNKYIEQAYENKKWAFVSDFVRLDVVYQYGGIYLDTDVELIKELETLRKYQAFMAVERDLNIATGLGFGAVAKNQIIKELRDIYLGVSFVEANGELNLTACPVYTTDYFKRKGYIKNNVIQKMESVYILSSDFFCPLDYKTGKMHQTDNTYGIHWYAETWVPREDRTIHLNEWKIYKIFPEKSAQIICKIYRNGFRLIEYIRKGTLIENVKRKFQRR